MSPAELLHAFERRFAPPGAAVDDRRKRSLVAFGLLMLIPLIVAFGVEDVRQENLGEAGADLALVVVMTGTLIGLGRLRNVVPLYRLGATVILGLLTYLLSAGGGEGYAFFWFYAVPIFTLTLFGQREGIVWALIGLAGAGAAFATHHHERLEPEGVWRFLVTYVLVLIFSYGLESARYRGYSQVLAEKASVEQALAEVRTLRGLLPICTRCKSVRNDRGYWQQIEVFIDLHSDAKLSHGLCPTCAAKLYPGLIDDEPAC